MGLKIAIVKTQSAVIYFKGFPPPKIKDSFGSKEGERKQGGKFIYLYYNLYKAKIPQSQLNAFLDPRGTLFRKVKTYPDHVMHSVDITVTHIDANGTESETVFLSSPMDDDWWFQVCDSRRKVTAG